MKHQTIKLTALSIIVLLQGLLTLKIIATGPVEKVDQLVTQHAVFIFHTHGEESFSAKDMQKVKTIADKTIETMRNLMPGLAEKITFNIKLLDRDLGIVNGVTGRADLKDEIEISVSTQFEGGIGAAIDAGLEGVLFHELHHTIRGWVIKNNAFSPGIAIAAVNEGLADVFAETQVGHRLNTLTNDEDFDAWVKEILALPVTANYGQWMFMHPDGRIAVGYRSGEYVVKKAMQNSGKDIIELSALSVAEIYQLAGYSYQQK